MGAILTTLLFTIGKILLGFYLGRASTSSAYGAAGSVIVILMWVYYASVILLFGAEFTQVYARKAGVRIEPSHYAVPVTQEERAQQGMPDPESLQPEPAGATAPAYRNRSPHEPPPQTKSRTPTAAESPGEVIHRETLGVMSLLLAAGFIAGTVLQISPLRKGLKLYGKVRKMAEL
jgi:hypothetical protein